MEPFSPLPYFWTDQYEVKIQFHGVLPDGAEMTIAEGSLSEGKFAALYRAGGQLTGALGWKAPARVLPYRRQLPEEHAAAGRR